MTSLTDKIAQLRKALDDADAVLIGAGAGLSAAAGLIMTGPRFTENFADFIAKYGFTDLYNAGFHQFDSLEEKWAFWSRHFMLDRYGDIPNATYDVLKNLVADKDYFIITTNVDHCFQRTGFDKTRLFYTQGDFGLFQCSVPCCKKTYDNEAIVRRMAAEQKNMRIPSALVPRCPICGAPMTQNMRFDDTFVEDEGWRRAMNRYQEFIRQHRDTNLLLLEFGAGHHQISVLAAHRPGPSLHLRLRHAERRRLPAIHRRPVHLHQCRYQRRAAGAGGVVSFI